MNLRFRVNTLAMTKETNQGIGNHLALDFLNTSIVPKGSDQESLVDGQAFLCWLLSAGAIDSTVFQTFQVGDFNLDDAAQEARNLRKWFQSMFDTRTGKPKLSDFEASIGILNEILAQDRRFHAIEITGEPDGVNQVALHLERRWTTPMSLLQPIALAIGDLFCNCNLELVKQCSAPNCALYFYDRTKAHRRRWCSMSVCGNRAKAAANRAKKRRTL